MSGISKLLHTMCVALLFLIAGACAGTAAAQAWTQLAPTGGPPGAVYQHTAVYDTVSNRMVVFGGYASDSLSVWLLSNANGLGGTPAWLLLAPTGTPSSALEGHTAVYDPVSNSMIVFGGCCFLNNTWVLSNANGLGGAPAWTQLAPSGTPPNGRNAHTAVYDPTSNRMVVFAGCAPPSCPNNDVWVLSNANGQGGTPAWTQLAPAGTPPSVRYGHTAAYDPATNRMVVYAGCSTSGCPSNEVWVLSNANGLGGTPTWSQLAPAGTPPGARFVHSAVYDPATNRLIVFAGLDFSSTAQNDSWMLSNANGLGGTPTWTQLAPTGTPPSARSNHTAVYDPSNNRMVVFAGYSGSTPLNDIWVLSSASGIINLTVGIDIKAGVTPNTITLSNTRDITVAILSSSTFNAPTDVDRSSLTFGHTGDEASLSSCNTYPRDVNGDSRMDLVCHFSVQAASFQVGDTLGYLKGMTTVGNAIHGSDAVIVK